MSTLFWLWLVSLSICTLLFVRGFVRAKMTPVSYEWSWSPITFVVGTVFPKGRALRARIKLDTQRALHRLFHAFFHQMKHFHDHVFGKGVSQTPGAPSLFLKTLTEHTDILSEEQKEERKSGLP